MENNSFNYYGNKDIQTYYNWITEKTKDDELYHYEVLANVNDYSIYDIMQFKYDCDGDYSQQFIELKGRYINFTDYPDSAIDYSKVVNLQRLSYTTGIPSYFCAIYYNDNKLCLWQIDEEKDYQFTELICQESQADPNRNGKVKKKMVLFPISEAKTFSF